MTDDTLDRYHELLLNDQGETYSHDYILFKCFLNQNIWTQVFSINCMFYSHTIYKINNHEIGR